MKQSEPTVVIDKEFSCSRHALWQALVDPGKMRQWFFPDIPDFRAEVGFSIEFMVDAGDRQFLHQWEVTEAIPDEKIAYRWRYAGYAGAALSVFEISGNGSKSLLRLSFPVEEDFPEEIPEFTREACLGGWEYFTGELAGFLEA